jgi:hypothetical protein
VQYRKADGVGANAAFSRTRELHKSGQNSEDFGNLYCERAHSNNEEYRTRDALPWVQKSLDLANQIPSIPLEVLAHG